MSTEYTRIAVPPSPVGTGLSQGDRKHVVAPFVGNWVDQISGSLAEIPEDDYQQFLDCCRDVRSGASIEEPKP